MILYNNNKTFNGSSNDVKPTSPIAQVGDKFYETDTQKFYEFDGLSWSEMGGGGTTTSSNNFLTSFNEYNFGINADNVFDSNCYFDGENQKLYYQQRGYPDGTSYTTRGIVEVDFTNRFVPTQRFCAISDYDSTGSNANKLTTGTCNVRGIIKFGNYLLLAIRTNDYSSMIPYSSNVYGILMCIELTNFTIVWTHTFGERLSGLYMTKSLVNNLYYLVLNGRMGFTRFYTLNGTSDLSQYSNLVEVDLQYCNGYEDYQVESLPTPSSSNLNSYYLLKGEQTGYEQGALYKCVSDGATPPTYSWSEELTPAQYLSTYKYLDCVEKMQENHHGMFYIKKENYTEAASAAAMPTPSAEYVYSADNRIIYRFTGENEGGFEKGKYYQCRKTSSSPDTYEWVKCKENQYTILFVSGGFADGVHVFDLTNLRDDTYADENGHKSRIFCWYSLDSQNRSLWYIIENPTTPSQPYGLHAFDAVVNYPYVYATIAPSSTASTYDKEHNTNIRRMGVLTLDISDLTNITATEQLIPVEDMGLYYGGTDSSPITIRKINDRIYLENSEKGIAIYDISTPSTPRYMGCHKSSLLTNTLGLWAQDENQKQTFLIAGEAPTPQSNSSSATPEAKANYARFKRIIFYSVE